MLKFTILIITYFIMSSVYSNNIEPKHLSCKKSTDCVLIGTGSCCEQDTAINKSYAQKFKKAPHKRCGDAFVICKKVSVTCKSNICKSVTKED